MSGPNWERVSGSNAISPVELFALPLTERTNDFSYTSVVAAPFICRCANQPGACIQCTGALHRGILACEPAMTRGHTIALVVPACQR